MLDASAIDPASIRPLHRDEYERLVELGSFENERIELLEGALVAMSPQGTRHAEVIRRLGRVLVPAVEASAVVQIQCPLALGQDSEPEPDVAIVPAGNYALAHPTTALLVIEVAESTVRKDRLVKGRIYACAGIPEYWVIDVAARQVTVLTGPSDDGYATTTAFTPADTIRPACLPTLAVVLADLLP